MAEKKYVIDNAELMAEWNWERNNELGVYPHEITSHSGKKVWWKCNNAHEWQSTIYNRKAGKGCPYCSGTKVLKGYNDLQTINPILAQEWNYEKNNGITPADVLPYSSRKVWWRCKKGHEWQATIYNRSKGSGCPICANERRKGL